MKYFSGLIVFAASLVHPAIVSAKSDALCAPLQAFAKSVQPGEKKSIDLHTSYGEDFKDTKKDPSKFVLAARRCNHYEYEPAKVVCAYLMQHSAIEFSEINLRRAFLCLSPKTRLDNRVKFSNAVISTRYGSESRGSFIEIRYADDPILGGEVLSITAEGY